MQVLLSSFHDALKVIDGAIGGSSWFVYILLGTGLFYTLYLGFPQFRYFGHALRVVRGKYDKKDDLGDTTHFQALTTALSGTVGTGNIAGVALAVHLGGPAALFWMLVTAFLGMTTKFVEVTLSHKYRETAEDGSIAGGPMYYMKNRLNMKWLAVIFALATILSSFGTGNLPQINSIANAMDTSLGVQPMLTGAVLSVLLGLVIVGGIKRIAKITEKLVPAMAIIYFIGAVAVILYNFENIPGAISAVFMDVFSGTAATGGFLGASLALAFNRGVNRGLFSNEAGQGSAPIAHAAAKAHEPVSEGIVALLEPFIDTIVICSLTGLTLLSSGVWNEKFDNQFQVADMLFLNQEYDESSTQDKERLRVILENASTEQGFEGTIDVKDGDLLWSGTLLHNRSVAEDVKVYKGTALYSGTIVLEEGRPIAPEGLRYEGKSLIHSAALTTKAFGRGWFGRYGEWIVAIGLLLFAFSTAITWSYYGDRAIIYLFGAKGVRSFRIVYVLGFFLASFTDTTIIWTLSGIAIALMTLPNLFGILLLHKEMRSTVKEYWKMFRQEHPKG